MELDTQGLETAHRAWVRRRSQMAQIDTTENVRERLALIAAIRAYVLTTLPPSAAAPMPIATPSPPAAAAALRERRTTVLVPLDTFVFDEG